MTIELFVSGGDATELLEPPVLWVPKSGNPFGSGYAGSGRYEFQDFLHADALKAEVAQVSALLE